MEEQQTIMEEELAKKRECDTPEPAGTKIVCTKEYMPQDIVNSTLVAKELSNIATTKELIKRNLVDKVDYGIIPGCGNKPSLFKPGAEKIIRIFHVSISYEDITPIFDIDKGNVSHTITCSAFFNGTLVQQGVGSANSFEKKFFRASKNDRLALDNTILKMAKKRALVDVALQLGSLSNTFTQDVEDFQDDIIEHNESLKIKKQKAIAKNQQEAVKQNMAAKLNDTISVAQQHRLFAIAKGDGNLVREAMNAVGHAPTDKTDTIATIEYNEVAGIVERLRDEQLANSTEPEPLDINKEEK